MDKPSPDGTPANRALSAIEAASLLGISQRSIRRAIASGALMANMADGIYRIDRDELEAFRATQQGGPPMSSPPEPAAGSGTFALPRAVTAFIGREAEVDALSQLLCDERTALVTLTGPGGVGKTRLALEVATALTDQFPDGVAFAGLIPVREAELVESTIARTFGFEGVAGGEAVERVARLIGNQRMLLVLDNFEHVLDAAPVVSQLIGRCPRLTVLATSRAPLRLSGEIERAVPPLRVIAEHDRSSLGHSEALLLFANRAQAVDSGFALTVRNAERVAAICERLDGLPLAIELAAARIKVLSPEELLNRLEPALPLLTGGPRDRPGHQQTVRETIAWSYGLLTPDEQRLFRQLSVFVGGFSLAAAEAVAVDADSDMRPSFVDGLTALVHQSLLAQESGILEEPATQCWKPCASSAWSSFRRVGMRSLSASDMRDG